MFCLYLWWEGEQMCMHAVPIRDGVNVFHVLFDNIHKSSSPNHNY